MKNELKIRSLIQSNTSVVDNSSGEVVSTSETVTQSFRVSREPSFVKLYLDCLSAFKDIQISLNPILLEFLRCTSYASSDDCDGGQILYLNSALKKRIALKCDVSVSRVNQAITEFVKKQYMFRIDVGTYQFNSELFGKGDWSDISNLRNIQSKFDFASNTVITDFITDDCLSFSDASALYDDLPCCLGDDEEEEVF